MDYTDGTWEYGHKAATDSLLHEKSICAFHELNFYWVCMLFLLGFTGFLVGVFLNGLHGWNDGARS